MKKTKIILFAVGLFLLAGCGNKPQDTSGAAEKNKTEKEDSGGGIVSSIKDAMNLGKNMECVYTTEVDGKEIKSVMQTDGKNFKSTSEIDGKKMYSIMKDEVSYTWGEGVPVASKLAMSCMKELEKDMPKTEGEASKIQDPKEAFDEASDVSCKPISSIDLNIPTDVEFQDMCEMMKGMANSFKDMKLPAGASQGR